MDDAPPLFVQLGDDLVFLAEGVGQRLAVGEVDLVGDIVDRHGRDEAAAVHLDKAVAELRLQLAEAHLRPVDLAAGGVDLGVFPGHQDVKHRADAEHELFSVGNDRNGARFRQDRHLFSGSFAHHFEIGLYHTRSEFVKHRNACWKKRGCLTK